ncbi:hypothetical protein M405DRAFT_397135 [Rhizopogon salebrosus TDB-379]|nr:hypothetical protein M405DRAFT_397135 [Rhizopogon salebrosus TDB-379]
MSDPVVSINSGNFKLDVSGVAGFLGGDAAVKAIKTIHLHHCRKWTGWYNAPGGYTVAKYIGPIVNTRFCRAIFLAERSVDPEELFDIGGEPGPLYIASHTGTFMKQTGYLAYLLMQRCKNQQAVTVEGRRTRPTKVTIVETQDIRFEEADTGPSLTIRARDGFHNYIALFPIAASVVTCILCAWNDDWYCFSLILLGILANGISCVVIGSAPVVLHSVTTPRNAPPGDGMLMDGTHVVVILGKEKDVSAITQGKFQLDYKPWVRMRATTKEGRKQVIVVDVIHRWLGKKDAESGPWVEDDEVNNEYAAIGLCSLLLVLQFVAQLLLIPQGTLFGQVMFLTSFAVSWIYTLFLSSMDKKYLHEELFIQALNLSEDHMKTYKMGTRTAAAVFACLALQPDHDSGEWAKQSFRPSDILRQFIPNDTKVWAVWRDQVSTQMKNNTPALQSLYLEACDYRLTEKERSLLTTLLSDARTACQQYMILQPRRRSVNSNGVDVVGC